jgi:site-specific DNA recombinase
MLQNRTYRGEATHKGHAYPGEHSAIVEQSLWEAVQAVLAKDRVARASACVCGVLRARIMRRESAAT